MSEKANLEVRKIYFGEKLKIHFREFNETTGIHGLRYLTENRSAIEKIFWVTVLLISFVGCLCMISTVLTKFKRDPVVVSFANRDTSIYEIPFPSVTVCPESKSSRKTFNYSDMAGRYMWDTSLTDDETRKINYMSLLCDASYTDQSPLYKNNDTVEDDFFDIINQLKPEDQIACQFSNLTQGNCMDFLTPIIVDEGVCYSFNILDREDLYRNHIFQFKNFHHVGVSSERYNGDSGYSKDAGVYTYPRRALISGADNALTVYFTHSTDDTDFICNKFMQGFRISLHYPGDIPRLRKSYFRVPLNKAVAAAIKPEQVVISESVKNMNPEKRNCYLQTERPLKHFKIYTQSNCLLECQTNYTLSKCGCVSYFMPRSNTTKICGPGKTPCVTSAQQILSIEELESKISGSIEQRCDCKASCSDLDYNVEVSQTEFYWKDFFAARNENIFVGASVDGHDFSVLTIYFKAEHFITIERNELYGTSDLVSNFGGLLGLFTGFSLISVIEVIYFFTIRVFYNIKLFGRWWGD